MLRRLGVPRYDPVAEKGRGETVTGLMKSPEEETRSKITMSHMDHKNECAWNEERPNIL